MADDAHGDGRIVAAQRGILTTDQGGDVVGDRAVRDQGLDLSGGGVECRGVVGLRLGRGGKNRLGELVLRSRIGDRRAW